MFMQKNAMKRVLFKLVVAAGTFTVISVFIANLVIVRSSKGRTYSDVQAIPHRRVGLVLGCQEYLPDRRPNLFFQNRVAAAVSLYQQRKVDYLLVSGHSDTLGYDEPADLKNALIAQGIPSGQS